MLGGGLGGSGECCGAALGMCMALGLACGSAQADPEKKKAQNALVHQAMDIFRQRQGATLCPELKRDKEGCDRIVSEAVKIAQDMLAQQRKVYNAIDFPPCFLYNIFKNVLKGGSRNEINYRYRKDEDASRLISTLMNEGHSVTKLATTGGFLRAGNTTLLLGGEDERVESALKSLKKCAKAANRLLRRLLPLPEPAAFTRHIRLRLWLAVRQCSCSTWNSLSSFKRCCLQKECGEARRRDVCVRRLRPARLLMRRCSWARKALEAHADERLRAEPVLHGGGKAVRRLRAVQTLCGRQPSRRASDRAQKKRRCGRGARFDCGASGGTI